jgi:cell division septation protein DedD
VPDAVTAAPPIRSLVWSLLGAVVALWLAYAVVAGMKQGSAAPQPASHAPQTAPVGLALTAAPALRVRSSLFTPGGVAPVVRRAPRHLARAKPAVIAVAPAPQTTMTQSPAPVTTPSPVTPVQATPTPTPTPAPTPAAKPRPQTTLTAQPKRPSGGGFDQSSASGFDQSG